LTRIGVVLEVDLASLSRQGLLLKYQTSGLDLKGGNFNFPYTMTTPTTFGVLLYAAAFNRLKDWRKYSSEYFGDFADLKAPEDYGHILDALLAAIAPKLTPELQKAIKETRR
jgi:hypothetical protein